LRASTSNSEKLKKISKKASGRETGIAQLGEKSRLNEKDTYSADLMILDTIFSPRVGILQRAAASESSANRHYDSTADQIRNIE
jgi:hypothetical protein